MQVTTALVGILLSAALAASASAQSALTLSEAMERARTRTPEARGAEASEMEAAERIREARARYFPQIGLTEMVQRGNQPVFVFSALLAQRRFTEANFAIPALNDPDPVTNVRTFVGLDQVVFDGGATQAGVRGARIGRDMAGLSARGARQDLAFAAAQAFVGVLRLEAIERAAQAALVASESDLQRARTRREAGLSTPADVLSVEVHVAHARQRLIAARADAAIARLQLSVAVGGGNEQFTLVRPSVGADAADAEALVVQAMRERPDLQSADLAIRAAANSLTSARAGFFPRVDLQGGVELNGSTFPDQRSSWIVGAQLQLNLFRGFADSARMAGARHAATRAAAEREALARRVEVDVRGAVAQLEAARAKDQVGRAALAQAREAHRIIRDRYDTGLATVTDVLRAAESVFEAESRATAAEMDVIVASVALDRAVGRL